MGRKVHPVGFRLGNYRSWDSQWYADRRFADLVIEDARIRDFVRTWLKNPPGQHEDRGGRRRSYSAGVSRILIRRVQDRDDNRRRRVVLTERGRELCGELVPAALEVNALATHGLSDDEKKRLVSLLGYVVARLG